MTMIKDGVIAANDWQHITDDETLPVTGKITVTIQRWLAEQGSAKGVRLEAADNAELLRDKLANLELIVLDMAVFTDGRPFSQARLLRDRLGYTGEIRARGDFLRDQMYYLSRVGVNSFEFPENTDLKDRLQAFEEFTVNYQASSDMAEPLYRQRAR